MPIFSRACVILLLIVASACGGSSPSSPTPSNGKVIGLSGSLAFGNVTVGQEATATVAIANTGSSTLTVTGMTVTSGLGSAFSASWTQGTIPAGGSQAVTVFFRPTAVQSYSGTWTVNGDQTSGTNTMSISAAGIAVDTTPLTVVEIAPSMAEAVASAIVGALEAGETAANRSTPPALWERLLAPILPQTVYADSSFLKTCRSGGNVTITGVSGSRLRYTLSSARATFAGCGWNAGRKTAVANGRLSLNGEWTAGDASHSRLSPSGNLDVDSVGSVPFSGEIGLAGYAINVGGAGIQTGKPDTPPTPNPDTCSATLSSTSFSAGVGGGGYSVTVTTGATCPWTASSGSGFISVTSGSSGRGNGTVTFSVAANTGAARTGSLSIAGRTVSVSQSGQTTTSLNIAGTWLETLSGSASSNGTQTVVLTQSSNGTIGGGMNLPAPATDVFSGTVSGSTVSGLAEVWRYNDSQGGVAVNCAATIRYTIAQASNTLMTGTFSSVIACSVSGPVPIPLPTLTDSGNVRFTKQ